MNSHQRRTARCLRGIGGVRTRATLRFGLLAAVMVAGLGTAAEATPPNVVLLVGDDMGYADLGIQGSTDIPTPNIDAIAKHGVRFTNGYVSAPQCSPTRAGLLTGRYQERFGHEFNLSPTDDAFGLPLTETTLGDRMKAAGYATGLVGKWHLGVEPQFHPLKRGFDEFFGFLPGAHAYLPGRAPVMRGTTELPESEYLTDALAREAVAFIDRHVDAPFFLYVAFNAPHLPMEADPPRLARVAAIADPQRRTYAAMMVAMDDAVGRIVDALRTKKILDDTLVIFLNDNGGPTMTGVAVNGSSNTPLRGSKRTLLEGGIRVPFFVQWPAKLAQGTTVDAPVIQLDLAPTVLAAAGVAAKPEWRLDGVNLLPLLAKSSGRKLPPPHSELFWRFGEQTAIRRGDWKLVRYDLAADGRRGLSDARLYDVGRDVGETTDVAGKHPDVVRELQQAWERWNSANAGSLWKAARH
jgi:arylsulfatase A-like enzyme